MKKLIKTAIAAAAAFTLTCSLFVSNAAAIASSYTYSYDWWAEDRESPNAYVPANVYTGIDFDTTNLKNPQSIFTVDNNLYICDTGNSRILHLVYQPETDDFRLERTIDTLNGEGGEEKLSQPEDVFVKNDGRLFICDTGNKRIVITDPELNVTQIVDKPEDNSIAKDADFLPARIVVDKADRLYVQAKNVNKGLMEFDSEGIFTGYMGANKVKVSMGEYLWKYFATDAQKSAMEQFVPTEYNNVTLDPKGFIYVTTSTFDEWELDQGDAVPIRRLNAMGSDILIRNGNYWPIGDLHWATAGGIGGSSRYVDVAVDDMDTYYCLDRVRGRIFAYDFQGNMLYAFGGVGNKAGYFQYPTSISLIGMDIFVLDYRLGTLTRFKPTEFGKDINKGLSLYMEGKYDESADNWRKVLKYNGNYDMAYIGIGRSLLRQGDYKGAMEYFELKYDAYNYSKAFQHYRKQWFEDRMVIIVALLLIAIIAPAIVSIVKAIIKLRKGDNSWLSKN